MENKTTPIDWILSHKKYVLPPVVLLILFITFFGYKDSTELVVKQGFFGGKLSCVEGNSWFFKGLDKTFTYSLTRDFYFNSDTSKVGGKEWEGDDSDEDDIKVTLSRNADAAVSGYLKYQLPTNCDDLIRIHKDQHSDDGVKHNLVRNAVLAAVKKTAPLYTAEEAKVTRVAEFRRTAEDQLTDGEYLTQTESIIEQISEDEVDSTGKVIKKGESQQYWITKLKLDSNGKRIITKKSTFKEYGIVVKQFDIQAVKLDSVAQNQLNIIKKREMQRVSNATEAETEKQRAITEEAKGRARVAQEQANQDVEKIKATVAAQKEREVAEIKAQQRLNVATKAKEAAKLEADAILLKAKAEAEANKLLVNAGIAPEKRLEMMNNMRVEVAKAIASSAQKYVPSILNIGNGGSGTGNAAMDAMGAKMYLNMLNDISQMQ